MGINMGKKFIGYITKNAWSILIFIMIVTMTSCNTTSNKKATDVVNTTVPTELSSPSPKTLGFSIERDKIDFVVIFINSDLGNDFHVNRARIYDKKGIDATIQILNSMEVYPKDESYKYYGGDSPDVMINFFDKQGDAIELLNIRLDLTLNEYILSCQKNVYKINSTEIDKIQEICELYGND